MPLAGLLFDKDGTLVDFDMTWGRATRAVMIHLSRGDPRRLRALAEGMHYEIGSGRFRAASPLIAGAMTEMIAIWGKALGRPADQRFAIELNEAFARETLANLAPVGDPGAVLDALRAQGLRLGLATNDGEASARSQLAALGIDAHLDFVAGFDSGHGGKPAPGMVLAFAEAIGVAPGRVALVGDTPHDMHAARAAGAVAIAVLSGPLGRAALAPLADHVIDSIADLPALVTRLP